MTKERLPTMVLRIITVLFILFGLLICVFVLPTLAEFLARLYPAYAFWQYPMLMGLYGAAACYFYAMFHVWFLLNAIEREGRLPVKNLRAIRRSAGVFSALYALFAMPVIFLAADLDDAPGLILFGAFLDTVPIGVAALAAVLEKHTVG